MNQVRLIPLIAGLMMLSGCGDPAKGVSDDARAAKAQAHEAVQAAEDAAARVDELSRAAVDQANPMRDGAPNGAR
jgi:hypothetical protein